MASHLLKPDVVCPELLDVEVASAAARLEHRTLEDPLWTALWECGRVTEPHSSLPKHFHVEIPDEVVDGHYADLASIWHTRDAFVLDFAALKAAPQPVEVDGARVLHHQTRVVTRVRVPPAQVFELMRALEAQLSVWEQETGRRPAGD